MIHTRDQNLSPSLLVNQVRCYLQQRVRQKLAIRPELLEVQLVLTIVNYHGNVEVSMLLNDWLSLTILQETGRR